VNILVAQVYLLLFVKRKEQFYLDIILTPKELTLYSLAVDSLINSFQKKIIMTPVHYNNNNSILRNHGSGPRGAREVAVCYTNRHPVCLCGEKQIFW
jgi:hypothetical protein